MHVVVSFLVVVLVNNYAYNTVHIQIQSHFGKQKSFYIIKSWIEQGMVSFSVLTTYKIKDNNKNKRLTKTK